MEWKESRNESEGFISRVERSFHFSSLIYEEKKKKNRVTGTNVVVGTDRKNLQLKRTEGEKEMKKKNERANVTLVINKQGIKKTNKKERYKMLYVYDSVYMKPFVLTTFFVHLRSLSV